VLAKLASGLNKPRQQTLVPPASVEALLAPLPLGRLRSLGGKFGEQLAEVGPDGGRAC
jgi:DNA polymerase eta